MKADFPFVKVPVVAERDVFHTKKRRYVRKIEKEKDESGISRRREGEGAKKGTDFPIGKCRYFVYFSAA